VLGLEVAVDDAACVGLAEALEQLACDLERAREWEPALVQQLAEVGAREQLRDEEWRAAFDADVVDGEDRWMLDPGGCARFDLGASQALGVRRQALGQALDRDVPPKPPVARPIDLAHPARSEQGDDLVRAKTRVGSERHVGTILQPRRLESPRPIGAPSRSP